MTEQSSGTPTRRWASRLMLGAAVLALPLTASITYAESLAPSAPEAPEAPAAPKAPKFTVGVVPPAPAAPAAPQAPLAPEAPEAPSVSSQTTIITVDPDTGETKTIKTKSGDVKVKVEDKKMIVLRELDEQDEDGQVSRYEKLKIINRNNELTDAEIEVIMEDVRESLADADEALKEMRVELKTLEDNKSWAAFAKGKERTVVRMSCDTKSDDVATTLEREDGSTEVVICQSRVMAQALTGLEHARKAIAKNPEIKGKMRSEILKELDQQIKRWKEETR